MQTLTGYSLPIKFCELISLNCKFAKFYKLIARKTVCKFSYIFQKTIRKSLKMICNSRIANP